MLCLNKYKAVFFGLTSSCGLGQAPWGGGFLVPQSSFVLQMNMIDALRQACFHFGMLLWTVGSEQRKIIAIVLAAFPIWTQPFSVIFTNFFSLDLQRSGWCGLQNR